MLYYVELSRAADGTTLSHSNLIEIDLVIDQDFMWMKSSHLTRLL